MPVHRFTGAVQSPDGGGESSFVEIPPELIAALGRGKRPPVRVTLNGVTYRTTVAVYGGQYLVGVRREIREAAGIVFGTELQISIELDELPRTVEPPPDLALEFAQDPRAASAFEALSYTSRKEAVEWIQGAKREETRLRRLQQTLDRLRSGGETSRARLSGTAANTDGGS